MAKRDAGAATPAKYFLCECEPLQLCRGSFFSKNIFFTFISNLDSLDWKNYGVDSIVSTVLNHPHLGNGSIILMHNGAKYTKDALPLVIDGLQKKGFEIVPISRLIYQSDYEMDHEGRQHLIHSNHS